MLYLRPLSSLTAQPLEGTEDSSYPFWSPDGREIGFFAKGKLKKIEASGGPPAIFVGCRHRARRRMEQSGRDCICGWNVRAAPAHSRCGRRRRASHELDASNGENSHRWPYFLPDGQHFLFWARSSHGVQEHTVCNRIPGVAPREAADEERVDGSLCPRLSAFPARRDADGAAF